MSSTAHKVKNSDVVLERLRKIVRGGGSLLIESLTEEELIAMQKMIFKDEAEITSSACKLNLVAKLEKTIIS